VRVGTPLSVEDAGDVIRHFTKRLKFGGKITLRLVDSFDALPDEVHQAAEHAGGTKDNTYAVLHKDGSIGLIRDTYAIEKQLQKSIFHEAEKLNGLGAVTSCRGAGDPASSRIPPIPF
jgi:hypothetical protein